MRACMHLIYKVESCYTYFSSPCNQSSKVPTALLCLQCCSNSCDRASNTVIKYGFFIRLADRKMYYAKKMKFQGSKECASSLKIVIHAHAVRQ